MKLLAAGVIALCALALVPSALAHQKHAASARIQSLWAGERVDLAAGSLASSTRADTYFWVDHHAGRARTWLKNFRFRGQASVDYANDALSWSGLGASQRDQLTTAVQRSQQALQLADRALAEATTAWRAGSIDVARDHAAVALTLARQAQNAWRDAERNYRAAGTAPITSRFDLAPTGTVPSATGQVVFRSGGGVDRLDVAVQGLAPMTSYSIFLMETGLPPFGANVLVGTLTTGMTGTSALSLDVEASDAVAIGTGGVVRLDDVVLFPRDVPAGGVATGFDSDGQAGQAVLTSEGRSTL
ncbi:MAG: hypothetical protein R3C15_20235 [Thermoleophilia bacterium]